MNAAAGTVEVRVPDMGNFKDVAIIDVLVKPGDTIEPEASLVTLETEKATMDVPSTVGGVVEKVHVSKGGTVSPGDLIVTVRAAGASTGDAAGAASGGGTVAEPASGRAIGPDESPVGAGVSKPVSGAAQAESRGTQTPAPKSAHPASKAAQAASGGSSGGEAGPAHISGGSYDLPPINEPGFSRAHAGPSVRRLARELGVDLAQVKGEGFKGRVTHDDVKAFVKKFLAAGPAGAGGAAATVAKGVSAPGGGSSLPSVPVVDFAQYGEVESKPLSRIQRISGPRLLASWVNIPHVTQFDEADITDLEELRGKLKQKALQAGIKLTPLAFIVRACVRALQEFPLFNSSLDAAGANLVLKKYIHVGFAADTPNGLVVPVVKDANRKDVYEIARQLGDLSEKARAGKLTASEMQGGSFTISSLGGIGGTAFTPIINAPEVAILGVSRSAMKPVFRDGAFVPRLTLPLSLSYDHRVIDGALAARFTTFLGQILADPHSLAEAVP
jgi:pyruvate dehydrogenase E2 component (dihydrolipoyllysine-residue acetyltransferase)